MAQVTCFLPTTFFFDDMGISGNAIRPGGGSKPPPAPEGGVGDDGGGNPEDRLLKPLPNWDADMRALAETAER